MPNMLLVLYRFKITGDQDAFERDYQRYLPQQYAFSGHLGELLTRDPKDPSCYLIVSRWEAAAFGQWVCSFEHDSITGMLDSYGRHGSSVEKHVIVVDMQDQHHATVSNAV